MRHRSGDGLRGGTVRRRQGRLQISDDRLKLTLKSNLVLVAESPDGHGESLPVRPDPKPYFPVKDEGGKEKASDQKEGSGPHDRNPGILGKLKTRIEWRVISSMTKH